MDNRLVISERHGTIEINGRPAFLPVASVPLAAPFNLSASSGDTVIDASVDAYPVVVDSYNWYLDGVLIATTADGAPSYQYTGLTNGQEYRVGVSVTVNGEESGILDWTNHIYDTLDRGHPTHVVTENNYNPQAVFHAGTFNRTYFVWMGTNALLNPAFVFYYDHDSGVISDSVQVGTATVGDLHLHAAIEADSLGHIYIIFERAHNDPYLVFKSTNPEDISAWTQLTNIGTDVAYPNIFVDSVDTIFATGRGQHDRGVIFKSTDGGSSFTETNYAVMADTNRWFYNYMISSRESQGIHILVNLFNEINGTYPDSYYIHTKDGILFENIAYYETGGTSGFAKDVIANGALTKAEIDTHFAIRLGATQTDNNFCTAGGVDVNGVPYIVKGTNTGYELASRSSGSWVFTDISSLVSTTAGSGIYDLKITSNSIKVWVLDYQNDANGEIIKYASLDQGGAWEIEEYTSVNALYSHEPAKMALIHNYFEAPETLLIATYKNGVGHSDIRSTIELAATATPEINSFSLSFDGVDDYVIADQPYSGDGDFTIEVYFKTSTTSLGNLVAFRQPAIGTTQTTQLMTCRILSTGEIEFLARNSAGTIFAFSTAGAYNTNTWYRAVWSRQGTEFKIRILDAAAAILETVILAGTSDNIVDASNKLILGTYDNVSTTEYYLGLQDDVRIWSYYRTDQQITSNSNAHLTKNEEGLLWYTKLNTGTGTVADDITSGNRDGTITGATWSTDTPF